MNGSYWVRMAPQGEEGEGWESGQQTGPIHRPLCLWELHPRKKRDYKKKRGKEGKVLCRCPSEAFYACIVKPARVVAPRPTEMLMEGEGH